MTTDDDVVLPNFTNVGEPTCSSSEGSTSSSDATVIYSSIPPDISMDSMSRATKSSVVGEMLRITKRVGGKLSVFACERTEGSPPSVYDRGQSSVCVVCHRTIADREMFLNFPDDLDRRRLWGNMLGFKYSDMLRLRDGSVVLSTGNICTDHFSEECFRVFNFNKAAIEALGMPSIVSPDVRLTPSKKWIPWDCTVCSFQSHSVHAMQRHMVEHTDDVLLRYHPKSPRGLLCPFCRKCTYGYKTMSGLRRHLMTPPVHHCQLKRIFEIARVNCRSSLLEPSVKWSSWTDRNVYFAYHGCEPPPQTPRKRPSSALLQQSEFDEHDDPNSDTLHGSSNSTEHSQSSMGEECTEKNLTTAQITPPLTPSTVPSSPSIPKQVHGSPLKHRNAHKNPRRSLIFSSPVKRDVAGQLKPTRVISRPILQLRKPLLPTDVVKPSDSQEEIKRTSSEDDDNKCRAVAKIILKATSGQHQTLADALNLMSTTQEEDPLPEDPALVKPLFLDGDSIHDVNVGKFLFTQDARAARTRRQLESVEARIRLFGDCSLVEVPSGYTTVETQSGVRLIEGSADVAHDISSSTICLPRGRVLSQMSRPPDIKEMFFLERVPSFFTKLLLLAYFPLGCAVLIIRLFIGLHAFLIACLLRKTTRVRSLVLRVMCAVLGIVVCSEKKRSPRISIICANHVSSLDHLAVDLIEPCILPSVWDVPALIRWCFGCVDLGARNGRSELIRRARIHVENEALPLLAFPEGAITNGHTGLLKFSSWPCDVSDQVQPLALQVYRPIFNVCPATLGSSWLVDVFWFAFLPVTVYQLTWLPILRRDNEETVESFSHRVECSIAEYLGIKPTSFTHGDAIEAAKRHLHSRSLSAPVKKTVDSRMLDEIAMRIKQSHPSVTLFDIRMDLECSRDQQ
ncbi:zinc finger, C2H2 type, partial [Necator americanus]